MVKYEESSFRVQKVGDSNPSRVKPKMKKWHLLLPWLACTIMDKNRAGWPSVRLT